MTETTLVQVGNRQLKLTNLSKVLYPETGFTKGQVLAYYTRMAPVLLGHLRGRALTLKRYPNGVDQPFFYEKNCPEHRPGWVKTATVQSRHRLGGIGYCVVEDVAALAWVANLGSIELHTSLALVKDVTRPTMMVFDLDPGEPAGMLDAIRVGQDLRSLLRRLGLECYPKVSGSKGLHVYIPLNTKVTYEQTKTTAREIALMLERHDPEHVTSVMRKDLRAGKVFIDWSQNDEHKTTVCVYSLRAKGRPMVSTPVMWNELVRALKRANADALIFDPDMTIWRAEKLGDLFAAMLTQKQQLQSLVARQ